MAYHQEGNEIVVDGFEKGIADNPFAGISDIRNANLISTPGECAVNFSTTKITYGSFSGNITSANAGADTVTYGGETGTPVTGMSVVFAGGGLPAGISAGTQSATADTNVYWVGSVNTGAKTFTVYSDAGTSSLVNITSDGSGTVASIDIASPTYSTFARAAASNAIVYYFMIDANGRVWGINQGNWSFYRFMGNITRANSAGNGIAWYAGYAPSATNGYIFVFRNALIDYMDVSTFAWTYGWKTMNNVLGIAASHQAIVGQYNGGTVYFCDAAFVGSFYQTAQATPFDPSNASTYTYSAKALSLPSTDIAQCLSELGSNLMVGGQNNLIYPWTQIPLQSFSFPIFLPEINVQRLITVNTNTFIFMGTRGRIYVTNGTNAELYSKIPDHLSGTVDPIFTWGAAGYHKNQLYFGASVTNSVGTALTTYGGLWAIDMETKALRMVNQLSYNSAGSFAGYATVFQQIAGTNVSQGTGFYCGWNTGSSAYGIDISASTPYTNYDTYVESDMIPVGTYLKNKTFEVFEWKLSRPLVSGENVRLKMRNDLTTAFTPIGTSGTADVGQMSGVFPTTPQERNQWLQLRAELNSTASSPSYVRLTQIRARAQTTTQVGVAVPI